MTDTVHCLSSLPASDGNFLSELNMATDEEINNAIDVMETTGGQHKSSNNRLQERVEKKNESEE